MQTWPNFFIVGAPRAGTTSIFEFLKQTKGVFMPSRKELHYFSNIKREYLSPPPIRDKKKYLALFDKAKDYVAIGEASPSYLWDPESPKLIHETIPNAKIIIILRDPVERAYSQFLLRVSGGKTYSFSEAIKLAIDSPENYYNSLIIDGGWYYEQVKRYLDTFGTSNVKVIIFEEFVKNTTKIIMEILELLEVDSQPPKSVELIHNYLTIPRGKIARSILNNKMIRKIGRELLSETTNEIMVKKILGTKIVKSKMTNQDRKFLEKLYLDDVKKLEKILGRKSLWPLAEN